MNLKLFYRVILDSIIPDPEKFPREVKKFGAGHQCAHG
jgi:hypothetical protein